MAIASTNLTSSTNVLSLIARPFRAVFSVMLHLAECGPRMDQVRQLNATSDEELAARGLTRDGEVRRIFTFQNYL